MSFRKNKYFKNAEFENFLYFLKTTTELPEKVDINQFTCIGCGEGSSCQKGLEDKCESCKIDSSDNCSCHFQCSDCYWCGCNHCYQPYYDNSGLFEARRNYNIRYSEIDNIILETVKQSPIPFELWNNLIHPPLQNGVLYDQQKMNFYLFCRIMSGLGGLNYS